MSTCCRWLSSTVNYTWSSIWICTNIFTPTHPDSERKVILPEKIGPYSKMETCKKLKRVKTPGTALIITCRNEYLIVVVPLTESYDRVNWKGNTERGKQFKNCKQQLAVVKTLHLFLRIWETTKKLKETTDFEGKIVFGVICHKILEQNHV